MYYELKETVNGISSCLFSK